jgi:hypothetical protein
MQILKNGFREKRMAFFHRSLERSLQWHQSNYQIFYKIYTFILAHIFGYHAKIKTQNK